MIAGYTTFVIKLHANLDINDPRVSIIWDHVIYINIKLIRQRWWSLTTSNIGYYGSNKDYQPNASEWFWPLGLMDRAVTIFYIFLVFISHFSELKTMGILILICIFQNKSCISVNGGWGEWTMWSPCSVTCLCGNQYRTRNCDNPEPEHGGNICTGDDNQTIVCSSGILCQGIIEHIHV